MAEKHIHDGWKDTEEFMTISEVVQSVLGALQEPDLPTTPQNLAF